jgi:ubiquinone/menaquinone biosynthesis C-methylase UbiE
MLLRARQKSSSAREILLIEASAAELPLADESFDAVMCILILSVVGDPRRCLQDALRVLRQGGRLVVFDKFAPEGRGVSTIRGAVNCVTRAFGTDINRRWNEISRGCNAEIQQEHSVTSGGSFRLILLRKVPLVEPPAAVPGERPYQ